MLREKIILAITSAIILFVLIQTIFLKNTSNIENNRHLHSSSDLNPLKKLSLNAEKSSYKPINMNKWGKDIFYDRKNIYNDWFLLTGITQFETGYKAIINGEIFKEMDRLKGFMVQEISDKKVVLKKNRYRVTLKLEE